MSFITYSQNFEDLMLWRALKDVQNGFYIDVGANDPIKDSVTKAFYDKGWSGINIEPEYRFFKALRKDRLRDVNLHCAVSSSLKQIPLYVSKLRGWSTTDACVSNAQEEKHLLDEVVMVDAKTLDEIIKDHQDSISDIHFLKVDVEGAEKDVLDSFSFSPLRPWIIMVEATSPGTNDDVSDVWEHILLDNDYSKIYFDGVNKYYLAKEKMQLAQAFSCPPNVVDDWIHIDHKHAVENSQRLQIQLENEKAMTKLLDAQKILLQKEIQFLKAQLTGLFSSKSWKVTKPLREVMALLKKEEPVEEVLPTKEELEKQKQKKESQSKPKISKEANKIYKDLVCE